MAVTKQHFELFADILRKSKPHGFMDDQVQEQWQRTVDTAIKHFKDSNPHFNENRFLERVNAREED